MGSVCQSKATEHRAVCEMICVDLADHLPVNGPEHPQQGLLGLTWLHSVYCHLMDYDTPRSDPISIPN